MTGAGRFYWVRNRPAESKPKGIVVVFVWGSISDVHLKVLVDLCFSQGWNSLVCRSDFLNLFIPERAASLALSVLHELIKELKCGLCPVVLASFSGGSKACMYKVLQILSGCSEVELSREETRLLESCISGQIYDTDPIDIAALGGQLGSHFPISKMPGSSKLLSLFSRGVTSGLDALFITNFGSQQQEYLQTLYSSVSLGAPFLVLCSEKDDAGVYSVLCNFVQHLHDLGGCAKVTKYRVSTDVGVESHQAMEYTNSLSEMLEQSVSVFCRKIQHLGESSLVYDTHDEISYLICDLQNAAVDSNQSFGRVAAGPKDHFFLPSSSADHRDKELGYVHDDQRDRSAHRSAPRLNANSVLGQALFDVCVPKTVEAWDIKFSGSLNGDPLPYVRKRSSFCPIKLKARL